MLIPKFDLYKSEWLELVFEKRNKSYGAYELRQHYSQYMVRALSYTLFGFVAIAITLSIVARTKQVDAIPFKETKIDLTKVIMPPPPKQQDKPLPPPPVKPITAKPLAPTQSGPTVVIPTRITPENVDTNPPTIADLQRSNVGSEVSKGTGAPAVQPITTGAGAGTGTADKGDDNGGVVLTADVAPEPNGGMAGWAKFLQRSLRYPDTEAQGRVFVSFIVERDGSLTDIKIVKGVSPELDAEALRVLRMAPKWKPGLQGGHAVRVQYNIPIVFQLNN